MVKFRTFRPWLRESHGHGAIVKVILETALLDDAKKTLACEASAGCRAEL